MRKLTKRSAAIATAAVLGVGAAGAAWAWSIVATGTGTATAATVQNLTVSGEVNSALYPTGSSDVTAHVTNPNSFPVVISGGSVSVTSAPSGCSISKITTNPVTVSPVTIGAGGNNDIVLANALTMTADAQQACAGGSFAVSINLTANTPG